MNNLIAISRKNIYRLFIYVVILLLPVGCARYIVPQPEFSWPEMETSKIDGALGIYISAEDVNKIIHTDPEKSCLNHKDIFIGQGIHQAIELSSQAVFFKTSYLGEEPSDTYVKSLNLRGLLHLKDVVASVYILPYGNVFNKNNEKKRYKVSVMINLNFSTIDFLLSDIRDFNVDVRAESDRAVPTNKLNNSLNNLSESVLEKAASQLARKLVNIYGARD